MTQSYASSVTVTYDSIREVYVGEMQSRDGIYRIEGPDARAIDNDIKQVAMLEYDTMVRELSRQKKQEFGSDVGHTINLNGHRAQVTHQNVSGVPVLLIASSGFSSEGGHGRGFGLKNFMTVAEISHIIYAAIHGNWFEAIFGAMLMALEDAHSKAGDKPKKLFAARFGGMVITATSRALLLKKLLLQKNRRIQIIMNHMRDHQLALDEARAEDGYIGSYIVKRIVNKKKSAQKKWNQRINPNGQENGWQARSLNLRKSLSERRVAAKNLWAERII